MLNLNFEENVRGPFIIAPSQGFEGILIRGGIIKINILKGIDFLDPKIKSANSGYRHHENPTQKFLVLVSRVENTYPGKVIFYEFNKNVSLPTYLI